MKVSRRGALAALVAWMGQTVMAQRRTTIPVQSPGISFSNCSQWNPSDIAIFLGTNCGEVQRLHFYHKGEKVTIEAAEIFEALK